MALLNTWRDNPDVHVIRAYACQDHWHLTSQSLDGISKKDKVSQ